MNKEFLDGLNSGKVRIAEKVNNEWIVHKEVKEQILQLFKEGELVEKDWCGGLFFDKEALSAKCFSLNSKIRLVPGGTSLRNGCYIANGVIIMPPSFVNIGAFVDEGTMIDSHVLVGSCAQIGKKVHLSAGVQIGGVLEPIGALPVIIEDDVFVGGNCGIYDGVVVRQGAVLGSGVVLNNSVKIYDAVNHKWLIKQGEVWEIPTGAVVVSGSRPLGEAGVQIYCPVIIKYKDQKTTKSVELENKLR